MSADNIKVMNGLDSPSRSGLYKDVWFWLMLGLGPLTSWALFQLMGGTKVSGLPLEQWKNLMWLVLLFPVIEEWLFRGLLQRQLLKTRFGCPTVFGLSGANGITSIVFATAHLLSQPSEWVALVIVPSLIFGWFRDRYESILPSVILHSSYNLGYFFIFGLLV
ncbi:MAG: JDVT-CTERM system glutamic-type intramembrane protease [Pseudomonadota bacterium]